MHTGDACKCLQMPANATNLIYYAAKDQLIATNIVVLGLARTVNTHRI